MLLYCHGHECRIAPALGKGEVCLRSFARHMRSLIPESRFLRAPARGWSNSSLLRT
jgi:hypothetical protein